MLPQVTGGSPGSAFPVGVTAVRYSSTDGAGNTAFCDFRINITDVWRPEITHCPASFSVNTVPEDILRASDGRPLVRASWVQPTATDNVGFGWTVDSPAAPSALLPVGASAIVYTAADSAGNTAVCTFDVTIQPTSLSYFTLVEQYSIEGSSEGGFFAGFVPVEACAERCLLSPKCKSFSVDREGKNSCAISYDDSSHSGYKVSQSPPLSHLGQSLPLLSIPMRSTLCKGGPGRIHLRGFDDRSCPFNNIPPSPYRV